MNYRDLQKTLKALRDKGLTTIKLNVKKVLLLAELTRIKALELTSNTVNNVQEGIDKAIKITTKIGVSTVLKQGKEYANQFDIKGINTRYDSTRCIFTQKLRYLKALYITFCKVTNNQFEVTADQLLAEDDLYGWD